MQLYVNINFRSRKEALKYSLILNHSEVFFLSCHENRCDRCIGQIEIEILVPL